MRENLETGFAVLPRGERRVDDEVFELFPVLRTMLRRRGGDLSGGQQQQLAIARALVMRPRLLVLDEPTEGIQPSIIKEIGRVIELLRSRGTMAILLVEQYLDFARALAQTLAVMDRGEIVLWVPPTRSTKPMYDAASPFEPHAGPPPGALAKSPPGPPSAPTRHQRARGGLHLSFKLRDGATVLEGLRQDGCLKARFPRAERDAWAGAVVLNTSGGVAGGDRLHTRVQAGPSTRATLAAQAAERFYRALLDAAPAHVRTHFAVLPGAALQWLPQASILFDRCALDRELHVDLAADAWFLGVEALVFGRAAMGEQVEAARLRDLIRLRRAGRLLLHDAVRLDGPVRALLDRRAIGAGARAAATLVHAAPDAGARLDAVRDALAPFDAGASAWDGVLVARVVAPDGACLRAATVAGLAAIRAGRPLPRVWTC